MSLLAAIPARVSAALVGVITMKMGLLALFVAGLLYSPLAFCADGPVLAGVGTDPTKGNSNAAAATEPSIAARLPDSPGGSTLGLSGYHFWPSDTTTVLLGPIGASGTPPPTIKKVIGARTIMLYSKFDTPTTAVLQHYESLVQTAGGGVAYSCDDESCGTAGSDTAAACLAVIKWYHAGAARSIESTELNPDSNHTSKECHVFIGFVPASGPDGDIYVSLLAWDDGGAPPTKWFVEVVESNAVAIKNVSLTADKMASDLTRTGKVDIYGIYFDTDKSDLKPASDQALQQITKLLQSQPNLHVLIVGNTDNQGEFQYNIGLSQRRAESVIRALVDTYHIEPSRITPFGDGMTAPVATNDTDAGRALNRRVEIVKR